MENVEKTNWHELIWKILYHYLGGGFKYLLFSPLPGEMIQFHSYFSNGLVQPSTRNPMRLFFIYPSNFICISAGWCMSINRYDCEDILYEIFAHLDQGFPDQDAHWLGEPSGDEGCEVHLLQGLSLQEVCTKSHCPAARRGPPARYKVVITPVITLFN